MNQPSLTLIRKRKPLTPSQRFVATNSYQQLTRQKPHKQLLVTLHRNAGRNNQGRITTRHKWGGCKKQYRLVDFKRQKDNIAAKVASIEYDPFRSCFIALIHYLDGVKSYIIAPHSLRVGDTVISGLNVPLKVGNCMPLVSIAAGTKIHNVELKIGKGGQIAKSAGSYATVMGVYGPNNDYVTIKMPSNELRVVHQQCRATVGLVSNVQHKLVVLGKAGASFYRGIRPTVRGAAMNPVDHPMGGGEGKSRGRLPKTPWGKNARGLKTRHNKLTNKFILKRIN